MENSNIGWTNHTANMWWGCSRVHVGCEKCYASEIAEFRGHNVWGNNNPRRMIKDVWKNFEKFQRNAKKLNEIHRVFVGSMMDVFETSKPLVDNEGNPLTEGIDEYWNTGQLRNRFFQEVVPNSPNLLFLLLTKRPSNINKSIPVEWHENPPVNVMFGTSVSDQETANTLIPHLAQVNGKRFISAEPLLGGIDLTVKDRSGKTLINSLDWCITGGESGTNARKIEKEWASKIKLDCENHNVPFYFKQWGKKEYNPDQKDPTISRSNIHHAEGGCLLDNELHMSYPTNTIGFSSLLNLFGEEYFEVEEWDGFSMIKELKSYMPAIKEELYNQLKENIGSKGMNDPILYFVSANKRKIVLDGNVRLKICRELDIKIVNYKEVTEHFNSIDDIKFWMIKNQFQKRNLTNFEKLQLAFLSLDSIQKMARANLVKGGQQGVVTTPIDTNLEISKIAGVSKATVGRFKFIMDRRDESDAVITKIINDLTEEKISISTAQNLIKEHFKETKNISFSNNDINEDSTEEQALGFDLDNNLGYPSDASDSTSGYSLDIKTDFTPVTIVESEINNSYTTIEEATVHFKSGKIEGVIILKNEKQYDLINEYLKLNFGFVILN